MLEAGLIASRFVHYAAVLALFGVALFPLYAGAGNLLRRLHAIMLAAAVVALLSAILWLAFATATMAGAASAAIDWDALSSVLSDTTFGHVWIARLALMVVILAVAWHRAASPAGLLMSFLTGLLLASLAGVGHTLQSEGADWLIHTGADALHLLAAGAWLGGLLVLTLVLADGASIPPEAAEVLRRFSGMGYAAVAVLVASGAINSWYLIGSFAALATTPYGQLLLAKLALFACMLVLAAANRFQLVPALEGKGDARQGRDVLARLRAHVLAEEGLGLLAIAIVSVLGTMEPAVQMTP